MKNNGFIKQAEEQENEYWKNSLYENPNNFSLENIANKSGNFRVFLEEISPYEGLFSQADTILEIGAGQGWSSCILKKKYKNKQFFCSDLSEYAIASVKYWEELFKVKLDKCIACKSYDIPLDNSSVDIIFCFGAFHHFRDYQNTLKEAYRILKPNGYCLFLYEPSCRKYIYQFAYKRVNKLRPEVPEDVLVYKEILNTAKEAGFYETKIKFRPILTNRKPFETIYYYIMGKINILQKILPCTGDFILKK
jgi:ubiquinone/menaquinone biosynthesis C-methylase UbiE